MNRQVSLADATDLLTDGTHYTPPNIGAGIPFLTVKDVTDGELDFDGCSKISIEEFERAKAQNSAPQVGDVLFSKDGTVGKVHLVTTDRPFAVLSSLAILRPGKRLDPAYLAHFLRTPAAVASAERRKTGSAIRRIVLRDLASLTVPLPPLDEQRRIAAILDKADDLRQKRRRAIALLDRLTQSIFLEMFGDPVGNPHGMKIARLEEVARFYAGNSLPKGEPYAGQPDGHLMLKVSDMNAPGNEEVISSSALWSSAPGSKAGTCPAGSIVFPKRGGAIATNKKRVSSRPAILDPNVMAVAANPAYLDADYLYQWFQGFNLADISSGSSVPQLNKQDLAPIEIVVPPLEMQRVFSERKAALNDVKATAMSSSLLSESLFMSFQHRAFSGEV